MFMLSCEIFTDKLLWQIRSNDAKHGEMYQNACSLAHSVDVNPSKPQICGHQQHRSNAHDEEDTVERYYRINITNSIFGSFAIRVWKQVINHYFVFVLPHHSL